MVRIWDAERRRVVTYRCVWRIASLIALAGKLPLSVFTWERGNASEQKDEAFSRYFSRWTKRADFFPLLWPFSHAGEISKACKWPAFFAHWKLGFRNCKIENSWPLQPHSHPHFLFFFIVYLMSYTEPNFLQLCEFVWIFNFKEKRALKTANRAGMGKLCPHQLFNPARQT